MFIARFHFKPEHADQFCWQAGQLIQETVWDDMLDLIQFCQEVEDAIEDCVVLTGDGIIQLSQMTMQ